MKKMKFFYLFMVAFLAVSFVSCGDDDDGPSWNKDELKGNYTGTEKIYLPENVMNSGDTIKNTTTVIFNTSSVKDALAVSIKDLLGDIRATNFGFSNDIYTFRLSSIPAITYNSTDLNGIPEYLINWFGKYYTFTSIDRVVLTLENKEAGKYDKNANYMSFNYDGVATYTYKADNTTKTQPLKIRFSYPNLRK